MDEMPAIPDVTRITRQAFEAGWEAFAHPRLHMLAQEHSAPLPDDAGIHYCFEPHLARNKDNESSSGAYFEFVDRLCRRRLSIGANIEPEVGGGASIDGSIYLGYTRNPVNRLGQPLFDSETQPREISHLEFETLWERYDIPRLHALLQL
jgi:hypothetical protein